MGMIELGKSLHFPDQIAVVAIGASGEHLDRDEALVDSAVDCKKDLSESAAPEAADDDVLSIELVTEGDHGPLVTIGQRGTSEKLALDHLRRGH